jgi:hypothetical protein
MKNDRPDREFLDQGLSSKKEITADHSIKTFQAEHPAPFASAFVEAPVQQTIL